MTDLEPMNILVYPHKTVNLHTQTASYSHSIVAGGFDEIS